MTVAPRPATVLVVSERGADAAHVRDALVNEFTRVEVSTHGELAVADFERVRPDVVVLAFDSIDKSQQYCVGLMRFSKVAQAHPHCSAPNCPLPGRRRNSSECPGTRRRRSMKS
jgi:hypothetical protein